MGFVFFNRNIADECHQKIKDFGAAGDEVIWVAFTPDGHGWSVLAKSGAYFNRNIPDECHQKMAELSKNGAKMFRVAFPPAGGNCWSIVNDHGAYFNRNIPDECHQQMGELSKNGAKIVSVAFPPGGGNSWSIVNDHGAYFNRNIPDECHQEMATLSKNGAKVTCVAFPHQGGNSWSVANNQGAYFNRNIPDEAHMYMGYYSEVYGSVRYVAFDATGNGWALANNATKHEVVCDSTRCVAIEDVYKNLQNKLNGRVVGYACSVGAASIGSYSHGYARTNANAPAKLFLPSTKLEVASVSKAVTALCAIRVLAKNNVNLDSGIGGHLPGDWHLDPYVASITFRQLLSHRSGIKDYGNVDQSYPSLKTFFTQAVDATKNTKCQGSGVVNPANPINPNDKTPCYSNYNFSIFRILLPWIDGFVDDPANRGPKLAAAYVKLVQKYVFEPVGAMGVDTKPPASGPQAHAYGFAYAFDGSTQGFDWGDTTAGAGAAGWYLAIEDIAPVLYSLNKNDGVVLTQAQRNDMEATPMGWDTKQDGSGYRWVEKNGGWGGGGGTISTSIALFGPGVYGALFLNSEFSPYSATGQQSGWQWCAKCHGLMLAGSNAPAKCPAGGNHDLTQSNNYIAATSAGSLQGQANWRFCTKCQAMSYAGGNSAGPCSVGGQHDHTGSSNYVMAFRGNNLPQYTQDNWRWCKKCQVLSYAGGSTVGACSGGGQHDHTGSGNYLLGFSVGADTILHDSYMEALKPKP